MDQAKFEQILNTSIEKHAFPGVVSIRQKDQVLYARAAGYAERSNRIKNSLETRFGIASGTKFFTALAIGKLIEAQKLSFSTRLKDCVALDFPRYSQEITIRHLLTHTSGIPDYYDEEKIEDFNNFTLSIPWYALRGPRDYLATFPEEAMKFAPGERFSYSNGGYILLGVVIEELAGMKYQDFVEQAIFKAIGMNRSGYFALNKLPENTAMGYVEEENEWRTNIYNLPVVGASDGGAFTTVHDITTLWKAFWNYQILPKELVEIYAQPYVRTKTEGEYTYYGHGLWISKEEGRDCEEYVTGCDAGVSFMSRVNRVNEIQVTVISNTTNGAWPVLRDIDAALKEERMW
ncbi:MAG: beta-lactamase family protein [Nodosilinea sp. WJT8-NPBG4]|jgi:CubicO group peptidase (beta-lactamase class C family)|nr:beta-lactamase family protein [Nodosilinea sp. WJT8-NPBG4]